MVRFLAAMALSLAPPAPLMAQTAAETQAAAETQVSADARARLSARGADIVAVLQGERPVEDVFTPAFRAAVPDAQLAALVAQTTAQFGPIRKVETVTPTGPAMAEVTIRYERAHAHGQFALEPGEPHRVAGFRLNGFDPIGDDRAALADAIAALPGHAAALLVPLRDGAPPLFAHDAGRQLAIGSSFKLWVLHALARQVADGERRWQDVIMLDRKSFASGTLHRWPDGAPLTVQTAATLMIAESDNTATDLLVRLVGQDALARTLRETGHADAAANRPFLTTRALYQIKADPDLRARWGGADAAARTRILAQLDTEREALSDVGTVFGGGPVAIDTVEWFASPRDVANVFDALRRLPDPTVRAILGVAPGMATEAAARWRYVGYKGGSEPGVLVYNWMLQDTAGAWYAASLMWNDTAAPVDEKTLELLAARLVSIAR